MREPLYLSLYQINTRVWLTELAGSLARPVTLDDIPDAALDDLARIGFDWIWLLSVWQTGLAGQRISRANREWRKEFEETLPDLREEDIGGSGFAITGYVVHPSLGGDAALARLRERLRQRGLRLLLDFVPNHMGTDHPWIEQHPDYFVHGSEIDLTRSPQNYGRVTTSRGNLLLAYGRDPYFSGWPDTLQLDYGNPATQAAMSAELGKVSGQCDGVRCDMAMLILPDVFERTWGRRPEPFWPKAIAAVRRQHPDFLFMAEVYWDLESTMQQQGFDYAYDKRLYDRLREGHPQAVRDHLRAGLDYQNRLARFLENHDEPRAAATFPAGVHEAAATLTYLAPGLRFFHQGQFDGRVKRISPHLIRGPNESVNSSVREFYERLLQLLREPILRGGEWRLLECTPAWEGNQSHEALIAYAWQDSAGNRLIVTVNYANHHSQCYVRLPFAGLAERRWRLRDLLGAAQYDRDGDDLQSRGLYLDVPPWQYHVFEMTGM
jgi:Alpha amylase, catalytic domain